MPHPRLTLLIVALEAIGTLAFAISGFIEARKSRLDAVGAYVIAFVTAFGGGTMRDILLERRPFYWVAHEGYVFAIFAMSLFAPMVMRMLSALSADRLLLVADAIGLGIFSISGTAIALEAQMPPFIAVMMGVITAVVGGIIRDVLCNDIPMSLRDSRPYATCAFAGCWLYLLLDWLGVDPVYGVLTATAFILVARLATYRFDIRLPH